MAACAFCGVNDPPFNTNREHYFFPHVGCIIIKKIPTLPPCTCPPPDPITGKFTADPNCPRHFP